MKESELADIVIKELEKNGYEIYSEVIHSPGSKRADIVAVRGDHYISVETKMSMNLTLIEQAWFWKDKVHETYICVPSKKKSLNRFALKLCKDLGIGVYVYKSKWGKLELLEDSSHCSDPDLPTLYEQQKDSVSGSNGGGYVTPFKLTCEKLVGYVKENGDCSLTSAVKNIDHHYRSDNSAKQSLHKMININVVKELEIFRKGREVWVTHN